MSAELAQITALTKTLSLGFVKSVQRGVTVGAGTVTITSVDTSKSVLHTVSKSSTGTVAATGTIGASAISASNGSYLGLYGTNAPQGVYKESNAGSNVANVAATSISGGTTNLTTRQYSAVLTNSTTITADGAIEWQLVEYY